MTRRLKERILKPPRNSYRKETKNDREAKSVRPRKSKERIEGKMEEREREAVVVRCRLWCDVVVFSVHGEYIQLVGSRVFVDDYAADPYSKPDRN